RLREENQQLDRQLSTWRGEWGDEQAQLEQQISALQQERDDLAKRLEEPSAPSTDASVSSNEVKELRQEVSRLRGLRKNHSQALEGLEKENRRLRKELRVVEGELNRTRHRMENRQVNDREIS